MRLSLKMLAGALVLISGAAWSQTEPAARVEPAGIAFVGRMVGNLDKSVAFYKAVGFVEDTGAAAWGQDKALDALFAAGDAQSRSAKLTIASNNSGKPFVLYLREFRNIPRKSLAGHPVWEPGATHFGVTVPDIDALWAQLMLSGTLTARSLDSKPVRAPGETTGGSAYITDPDGLDVELANQRTAAPATEGRPAVTANPAGFSHVGVVVLDKDKARAFYTGALGAELPAAEPQWRQGDFVDALIGGHGNVVRVTALTLPEAAAPNVRMKLENVEYQGRNVPVKEYAITDIGVEYRGLEVHDLKAALARVTAMGATVVSKGGIVTLPDGGHAVVVREPDAGAFVELFEPRH